MKKVFNKNKIFSSKLSSFNIGILFELEKGNDIINKNKHIDPLLNSSKDIEEIKNILKSNPHDILYYIYFNMKNIESILYNKDEIIFFDFNNKNKNFFLEIGKEKIEIEYKNKMAFLFYISLLIKYNKNVVNFSFPFTFINKINSINKIKVSNIYINVLISKIILELINYYKSNQIFKEKINKKEIENLNEIENSNNNIIDNCIDDFNKNLGLKLTQKELKLKNIDLIYAEIINNLLISKDYDLTYKVIEQLDLENINITKAILNEISETLISNENLTKKYKITTLDDLQDSKKITFYYILFKFILKDSVYIYYFNFLNETRKTIIKIIKLNQNQLKNLSNNDNEKINNLFKNKIIYLINFFTNSHYYIKNINSNLNDDYDFKPFQNLSYKNEKERTIGSKFELNKDCYKSLEERNEENHISQNINNDISISNDSTLKNKFYSENAQQNNKSTNDPNENEVNMKKEMKKSFLNDVNYIFEKSTITLHINKENKIEYKDIVHSRGNIAYNDLINPFQENPEIKFEEDTDENYKKLIRFLDKIKGNNSLSKINLKSDLFININLQRDENNPENINSEYCLGNIGSLDIKYQDKNILNIDNYKGFTLFLQKIINNPLISTISIKNSNDNSSIMKIINEIFKYRFIFFKKVIEKHNKTAEKIRELDNGYFVSGGYNEISKYDKDYNKIEVYNNIKNYYSFFVDINDVIISQKNKLSFLNNFGQDSNINFETKYCCRNLFSLENGIYLICDESQIYYGTNTFKKNNFSNSNSFELNKQNSYRGGIKINDDKEEIIAITSNRILSKGENKLIFLSSNSKIFLRDIEVENYSFILSENNCALMKIPKQEKSKLLLVACKKYIKDDKNGILLLKMQMNKDHNKQFIKFYDTKNFEVYCFCPILETIENKLIFEEKNKMQIKDTEYFFVGGFDLDKREGLIKLYKVIYNDDIEKIKIEYIQDIILEKKPGIYNNSSKFVDQTDIEKKDLENFKGFIDSKNFYNQSNKGKKGLESSKEFKDSKEFFSQTNNKKKDLENFKGFKGPISCIIQSTKGILITCYDGNVYLFSTPNIKLLLQNEDYNNILKKK